MKLFDLLNKNFNTNFANVLEMQKNNSLFAEDTKLFLATIYQFLHMEEDITTFIEKNLDSWMPEIITVDQVNGEK